MPTEEVVQEEEEERFDVLDEHGAVTGVTAGRRSVHAQGLLHRAVHIWLWAPGPDGGLGEVLLQRRARCKDSWPGRWDISSAGHVSAGEAALPSAQRELQEELGLSFPADRLEWLYTMFERMDSVQNGKPFRNHEFMEVYVVTLTPGERASLQYPGPGWCLQADEVEEVAWFPFEEAVCLFSTNDPSVVPCADWEKSAVLWDKLRARAAAAGGRT